MCALGKHAILKRYCEAFVGARDEVVPTMSNTKAHGGLVVGRGASGSEALLENRTPGRILLTCSKTSSKSTRC